MDGRDGAKHSFDARALSALAVPGGLRGAEPRGPSVFDSTTSYPRTRKEKSNLPNHASLSEKSPARPGPARVGTRQLNFAERKPAYSTVLVRQLTQETSDKRRENENW